MRPIDPKFFFQSGSIFIRLYFNSIQKCIELNSDLDLGLDLSLRFCLGSKTIQFSSTFANKYDYFPIRFEHQLKSLDLLPLIFLKLPNYNKHEHLNE